MIAAVGVIGLGAMGHPIARHRLSKELMKTLGPARAGRIFPRSG